MSEGRTRLVELFGLHGKTAIVTGATSGIGAAVADLFLAAGARVVVAASTASRVEAAVAELGSQYARTDEVIGVPTDVSKESDVIRLFDTTTKTFGEPDVLVNCAGVFPVIPFTEVTVETWARVHAINSRGAFLCIREAVKQMQASGRWPAPGP